MSSIIKLTKADHKLVEQKVHDKIGDLTIEAYERRFNKGNPLMRLSNMMGEELEVSEGDAAREALTYYQNAFDNWYRVGTGLSGTTKFKDPKVNLDYIKLRSDRALAAVRLIERMYAKEMEIYSRWVEDHCTKAKYMNLPSNWLARD